ncbi:hypothetical protein ACWEKT_22725 [Nocardia takedensis]
MVSGAAIVNATATPTANGVTSSGTYTSPEQCAPAEESALTRNVVTFDGAGERTGAFYAGDAIAQLQTDPSGTIWISYLDEATYRTAMPDGTWGEYFLIGLARWDDPGGKPWFVESDTRREVCWCDCYALNVGRTLVNACPYTDFPLVEMDANGVRSITPNPITRCTALAVADSELAFLDQVRLDNKRIWTIRRGRRHDGMVTETGTELLTLPGGRSPKGWARGKIGRDATIWLHEDGNPRQWYRYEIDC